jgi:hypothetical protein
MAKEAFDLADAEARRELLASEKTDGGAALDQNKLLSLFGSKNRSINNWRFSGGIDSY